jgi:hypothetical protein
VTVKPETVIGEFQACLPNPSYASIGWKRQSRRMARGGTSMAFSKGGKHPCADPRGPQNMPIKPFKNVTVGVMFFYECRYCKLS